jgi:photosystem II stability/assembly factor-like uncharacterized protein
MVAVVAITLGTVGVLLLSRNARHVSHQGPASASRLASPMASPTYIPMPSTARLSAPSSNVVWAQVTYWPLFRSTDQGNAWEQRALPMQSGPGLSFSFINDREGWLLAPGQPETQCTGAGAVVWHTTDGAASWQQIASVQSTQAKDTGMAYSQCKDRVYFYDSTHGFVTAWDDNHRPTIYRTADGGKTWSGGTLPDPPDFKTSPGGFTLRAFAFKRFGNSLYLKASGMQGGDIPGRQYMFRSTDGGTTWSWMTKIPSPYIAIVTESRWLQLIWPGQSMESTNGGQQWHPYASDFSSDTPVGGPQIVFADAQVGYAEGRGALQRTVDGGLHWARIATPGIQQPGSAPPPVASGARTNPSPAASLPVTDPGFTCRLPVSAGYWNGGFVTVPRGAFEPDPAARMLELPGWTETSTKPVLKGPGAPSYDVAFSRWVPTNPEVVSSDGSQYAWTEREPGNPNILHVTKVADGSDRAFDVSPPPRPRDPDLGGGGALPIPIGVTRDVVFFAYGWEGIWSVWRLDLATGSHTKVSAMKSPSYAAGAVWAEPTRGPNNVGMYSDGDTLTRLDLTSGAIQDWFHRDNVVVRNLGSDLDGKPWVQVLTYDRPGTPIPVLELWRVSAPGKADLMLSGQRFFHVTADKYGTWFGNESGVYLYGGSKVIRVSSASVSGVVGPCI